MKNFQHDQNGRVNFSSLAGYAAEMLGVTLDIRWGNDWVASVGGQMFLVGGPHPGAWRHGRCKVDDFLFLELTGLHGFKPAPYLACYRWMQVSDARAVPLPELKALVASKQPKRARLNFGVA